MGIDKMNAKTYAKIQTDFVRLYFSEIFALRMSMAIKPRNASVPRTMQKGINLGYCAELSSEIAMARLSRCKRHDMPKLKNAAVANEKGRTIKVAFFMNPPVSIRCTHTWRHDRQG